MKLKNNGQYTTWGRGRSNRLLNYDYSEDRPIHVTICTDDKKNIFVSEVRAKIAINELLKTAQDLRFRIICYCLMPDHLHVVVSLGDSKISFSKFLNIFKGRTTSAFRKAEGIMKIWQRSAYDHIIRVEEDLGAIIQYIRNNPVRKGIVEKAEDYPYSKWFAAEVKRYL